MRYDVGIHINRNENEGMINEYIYSSLPFVE